MLFEDAKRAFERLTGIRRPKPADLRTLVKIHDPVTFRFRDDGETPNNPTLPLVIYRRSLVLDGSYDPAAVIEELFAANGWADSWRDGIYDFRHFHTRTHEVLGLARGSAKVEFGGRKGKRLGVKAGDVIVIPAGTGHRRISASDDLLVVGAYPRGGKYDEPRPGEADHDKAVASIAKVKPPKTDPLYGRTGSLRSLWNL